jgi:hypothetical protein
VITKFGTLESTVAVVVTQNETKPKWGLIFEIEHRIGARLF